MKDMNDPNAAMPGEGRQIPKHASGGSGKYGGVPFPGGHKDVLAAEAEKAVLGMMTTVEAREAALSNDCDCVTSEAGNDPTACRLHRDELRASAEGA